MRPSFLLARPWVTPALLGLAVAAPGSTPLAAAPPPFQRPPSLQQLADRYWSQDSARFPARAVAFTTDCGPATLEDLSPAANRKWQDDLNGLLKDVRRIPAGTLNAADRLTLELLERSIRDEILRSSLPMALVPLTPFSGPLVDLRTFTRQPNCDDQFISRLKYFPKQIADLESNLHAAARSGYVLPCLLVEKVLPQIDMNKDGEQIITKLRTIPFSGDRSQPVLESAESPLTRAVSLYVEPGLRSLHAYLLDEYMPLCRSSIGLGALPGGNEIYTAALRLHATIPVLPEGAHELGLTEVKRLRDLIEEEKISSRISPLDWDEFQKKRNFIGTFTFSSDTPAFRRQAGITYPYWFHWYICDYLPLHQNKLPTAIGNCSILMDHYSAALLVVDTGIHAKGWSYDQAVAYLKNNTSRTDREIESDVIRCVSLPGEAAGAEIGRQLFNALRREAEEKLGDRFDVRAFYETLLSEGPMPLDLLESRMRAWIESRGKSP